ncbi:serine/threonine-protein kinase [Haliangium sp.]|uniref:serine/threonine-protein kinase n=1 Tax=Haliangium sp. TaxID=2663208 RepID=UPI003D121F63
MSTPQLLLDDAITVGRGGWGRVQRATLRDGRAVAVKRTERADAADRLWCEATLLAKLEHENIVRFYEVRERGDEVLLIEEYVDGGDLRRLRAAGLLPLGATLHIARQLLAALGYLHQQGYVHADLSPGNILISTDGTVKVTDLGLARRIEAAPDADEPVRGTPGYVSPEALLGESQDGRSDLYAVGVILWELATGVRLFQASSREAAFEPALVNKPAPSPRLHQPDLPEELERVIMRLLERRPEDRFADAAEALTAMPESLWGRAELARVMRARSGDLQVSAPKRRRRRRRARRRWWLLPLVAAVAVGLGWLRSAVMEDAPATTPVIPSFLQLVPALAPDHTIDAAANADTSDGSANIAAADIAANDATTAEDEARARARDDGVAAEVAPAPAVIPAAAPQHTQRRCERGPEGRSVRCSRAPAYIVAPTFVSHSGGH